MGLTVSGNALVVRDGKLGTEQACCCEQCVCPNLCSGITFDVEASIGGMTVNASAAIPGTAVERFEKDDDSGDYIEITLAVACGEVGPNNECGWGFSVGVCYQSGGIVNGETLQAFQEKDSDGCPDVGAVDLQCLGFCSATVSGEVA
jgi:hypothetical protein